MVFSSKYFPNLTCRLELFKFLEPTHGDTQIKNLRKIKKGWQRGIRERQHALVQPLKKSGISSAANGSENIHFFSICPLYMFNNFPIKSRKKSYSVHNSTQHQMFRNGPNNCLNFYLGLIVQRASNQLSIWILPESDLSRLDILAEHNSPFTRQLTEA
jgi:hypothetical protein